MTLYSIRADLFTRTLTAMALVVSLHGGAALADQPARAPAKPATVTECDRLAADPQDQDKVAPGVPKKKIDAPAAIKACRHAVAEQPDQPRLLYQLARALIYGDRFNTDDIEDSEVVRILNHAAESGYPAAQLLVGLWLLKDGTDEKRTTAIRWVERAADTGNVIAQIWLGDHFSRPKARGGSFERAVTWYQRAHDQGNAEATVLLGTLLYQDDRSDQPNRRRGLRFLRTAANGGNLTARTFLATYSIYGEIDDFSEDEAVDFLTEMAKQGSYGARITLFTHFQSTRNTARIRWVVCTAPERQRRGLMIMLENFEFCN